MCSTPKRFSHFHHIAVVVLFQPVVCFVFSLTMPAAGTVPSKPFTSITKPTVRLRSDFKLKLAKQRTEDEERRRRQAAALSGSQPNVTQTNLSTSLNESSRPSNGLFSIPVNYCHFIENFVRQMHAFVVSLV
jgi:hypothetical protein